MPEDLNTRQTGPHQPAGANSTKIALENKALVIGIDSYIHGIPPLKNAVADATAISCVLRDEYNYKVVTLVNEEACKSEIERFLNQILDPETNTRCLFYFAGHGTVKDGQGYLVPQDARRNQPGSYLSLSEILKHARTGNGRELLLIIDACYSGQALITPSDFSDLIPSDLQRNRIVQVMTSGNPDQPVLDSGGYGNSIFTKAFAEALAGWSGVHDENGAISFSNLLSFLKEDIKGRLVAEGFPAWSQQVIGGNLIGNRSGRDFTFRSVKPRLASTILQQSRDPRPTWRIQALERLPVEVRQHPSRLCPALTLAASHIQRRPGAHTFSVVQPATYYEPDAQVRARAAAVLGQLGDPSALGPLKSALEDENEVCRAAAVSLMQLKDIRASSALVHRLYQAPGELFLDLVKSISGLGDPHAIMAAVVQAYKTGRLVPFIGPDLPKKLTGLPDRATLANQLAESVAADTQGSFVLAAQASMAGGSNRYTFTRFIADIFKDSNDQPGPLLQAVKQLEAPIWLYANYDDLFADTINAQVIVSGSDSEYWQPDRPAVISLLGSAGKDLTRLVVLEQDYRDFRPDEKDREKLVKFINEKIDQKVILMIGFDPSSRDFSYLVNYILNVHLYKSDVCPIIVWRDEAPLPNWSGVPLFPLRMGVMEVIKGLSMSGVRTG